MSCFFHIVIQDSSDGNAYFVKVHCPWDVLTKGAALLKLRKRIKLDQVSMHSAAVMVSTRCRRLFSSDSLTLSCAFSSILFSLFRCRLYRLSLVDVFG